MNIDLTEHTNNVQVVELDVCDLQVFAGVWVGGTVGTDADELEDNESLGAGQFQGLTERPGTEH